VPGLAVFCYLYGFQCYLPYIEQKYLWYLVNTIQRLVAENLAAFQGNRYILSADGTPKSKS
jgi:hypothetical protein